MSSADDRRSALSGSAELPGGRQQAHPPPFLYMSFWPMSGSQETWAWGHLQVRGIPRGLGEAPGGQGSGKRASGGVLEELG